MEEREQGIGNREQMNTDFLGDIQAKKGTGNRSKRGGEGRLVRMDFYQMRTASLLLSIGTARRAPKSALIRGSMGRKGRKK